MKKRIIAALATGVFFFPTISISQSWQFVGPDSVSWRGVRQMDVRFKPGASSHIGVATAKGVAANLGSGWRYVLPNSPGYPIAPDIYYRSVYFSPWSDSVAFVGVDLVDAFLGEPGSSGGTVSDINSNFWRLENAFSAGWVGHVPSLSFAFSPRQQGRVYTWIVDFYRTTNNGQVWQAISSTYSYGSWFLAADQMRDSVLYAGLRRSSALGIFRSTDDGFTWSFVQQLPLPTGYPHPYTDFFARGDTLLYSTSKFPQAADSTSGLFLSLDYGVTWNQILPNINVQKLTRDAGKPNVFFAAVQGGIYRSATSGLTWQLYVDSLPSLKLVDIRKDPYSDTLYVAAADSGVYKMFDRTSDVKEKEIRPTSFALEQNYPNPFNPATVLSYDLPEASLVLLRVYDMVGREVATVVNGEQIAGRYRYNFDAAGLASGVYLYKLSVGKFSATKKMIVAK